MYAYVGLAGSRMEGSRVFPHDATLLEDKLIPDALLSTKSPVDNINSEGEPYARAMAAEPGDAARSRSMTLLESLSQNVNGARRCVGSEGSGVTAIWNEGGRDVSGVLGNWLVRFWMPWRDIEESDMWCLVLGC